MGFSSIRLILLCHMRPFSFFKQSKYEPVSFQPFRWEYKKRNRERECSKKDTQIRLYSYLLSFKFFWKFRLQWPVRKNAFKRRGGSIFVHRDFFYQLYLYSETQCILMQILAKRSFSSLFHIWTGWIKRFKYLKYALLNVFTISVYVLYGFTPCTYIYSLCIFVLFYLSLNERKM